MHLYLICCACASHLFLNRSEVHSQTVYLDMEGFIICELADDNVMEVDVDEDGSVCLDTLKCLFGSNAVTLTYVNEVTGRERVVQVNGNSLLEPKHGWRTTMTVYTVSCGSTPEQAAADLVSSRDPRGRSLISHLMIKREAAATEAKFPSIKPSKSCCITVISKTSL